MSGERYFRRVTPAEVMPESKAPKGRAPTLDDFLAIGHGLEVAMTDTGKTNDLRYFATNTRLVAVLWNPEDEPMPGVRVTTPEALYKALKEGARKVNFVPDVEAVVTDNKGRVVGLQMWRDFAAVRSIVRAIGDEMRAAAGGVKAPIWCVVFVDEVQQLSGEGAGGKGDSTEGQALTRALQEDRKRGVHYWMFTQDPRNLPTVALGQSRVFMVKTVKANRIEYLTDYIPMDLVWKHVQKPFHFAVVVDNSYALCTPLPYVEPKQGGASSPPT